MKLLIISYSYTPDLTPRAFRWSAVAAQLVQMGHEVHVLCAAAPGLSEPVDDGVTVYRVRDFLLNGSSRVTPGAGGASPSTQDMAGRLRALFRTAARSLWRAFYWPDFACGWVLPAAKVGRTLCASNGYDWVISVSHPFSGHVVGMLSMAKAPSARWLADIGDPFHLMKDPAPNNRRLYSWLNRVVESRVVVRADAISVTTDSTCQLYEQYFSFTAGKVEVIPPVLSLPASPAPSEWARDDTIRLVFVGTLYRNLRSPKYLLACMEALVEALPERQLELHFYGSINDCGEDFELFAERLESRLFIHGMVSRMQVLQAMVDSDILVNIGNDSEAQLASKVIEYMAIGKPILNLVSIQRDTSVDALAEYSAALSLVRDESGPSAATLKALCEFVQHPPLVDAHAAERVRLKYSPAHVAGLYATILEREAP